MPHHRLLLAAALACAGAAPASDGSDLVVALRPGAFADAVRRFYVEPFTADTGTRVLLRSWSGGLDALRPHAGPPAPAAASTTSGTGPARGAATPGPATARDPAPHAPPEQGATTGRPATTPGTTPPGDAAQGTASSPRTVTQDTATQDARPPARPAPDAATRTTEPREAAGRGAAPHEPSGAGAAGAHPAAPSRPAAPARPWGVVDVSGEELVAGCAEGLLQHLDWSRLGGRDHYLPQATAECGVGALLRDTVVAWDRDKLGGTPSWGDFWDVAKHPGKRGLPRSPRLTLEIALLADGVAAGEVYPLLRTDEGVDRAFRKLDQLKPYVVWWEDEARAPELLASGEVLLTAATSDDVLQAAASGHHELGVGWAGALQSVRFWSLPRRATPAPDEATPQAASSGGAPSQAPSSQGAPSQAGPPQGAASQAAASQGTATASGGTEAAAYALLAAMGDPRREAALAAALPLGVPARGATEGLTPAQLAASPSAPANLAAILPVDEGFWRDNAARLGARFTAWLGR